MNIIYITRASKNEFSTDIRQAINIKKNGCRGKLVFYKKNKNIIAILNDMFSNCLSLIITEYHKEEIIVEYNFFLNISNRSDLRMRIKQYNFEIIIAFNKTKFNSNNNYTMCSWFSKDTYGIKRFTSSFTHFNKFMLKYYNKERYFENYDENYFTYE